MILLENEQLISAELIKTVEHFNLLKRLSFKLTTYK